MTYTQIDSVLFQLAHALVEMKHFDRARQVYHRLIKGYPNSKFVGPSFLSFAEYYFAESDLNAARQFYTKVEEIPAAQNPAVAYAHYKKAWTYYRRGLQVGAAGVR